VIRKITEELAKQFGQEKGTIKYFHALFLGGIHQAFLIAGLPMQDSCCQARPRTAVDSDRSGNNDYLNDQL